MSAWTRKTQKHVMSQPDTAMTVASLAKLCGVPRQRMYFFVREGFIAATPTTGGYIIMAPEVKRVLGLVRKTKAKDGSEEIQFDFSRI
jgi:hypothetical protein